MSFFLASFPCVHIVYFIFIFDLCVWGAGLLIIQGSRRAVLALGHMGLDVWVVTGDNRRVAAALARRLGVSPDRVMSEVLPAQKARKVNVRHPSALFLLSLFVGRGAGNGIQLRCVGFVESEGMFQRWGKGHTVPAWT